MAKYTITPWRHQSDLLAVRAQLFNLNPDSSDSRRRAVDRIMAWKLRGNLPHAVESTALLIDAQLHHSNSSNSSFSVRAVYTAAFTRFVTGFCDIGRAREGRLGMEQSSMLDIARQISMPEYFVALRHEATHEEMPSLRRLVDATQEALEWLWRVYWSRTEGPEVSGSAGTAQSEVAREEARRFFKSFRSARREAFRANKQHSREYSEHFQSAVEAAKELCGSGRPGVEAVTKTLVDERLLVPAKRESGTSMEGAFQMWDELIEEISLAVQPFLPALVQRLLAKLTDNAALELDQVHDVDSEALYLWLVHLADYNHRGSLRLEVLYALNVDLMKSCCLHPGYWTQKFGQELLRWNDEDFDSEWKDLLEASMLQDSGGVAKASVELSDPESMRDIAIVRLTAVDDHRADGEGNSSADAIAPWRRALVAPNAPIGVVV